jgi:hypothetical protein
MGLSNMALRRGQIRKYGDLFPRAAVAILYASVCFVNQQTVNRRKSFRTVRISFIFSPPRRHFHLAVCHFVLDKRRRHERSIGAPLLWHAHTLQNRML